MLHPARGIRQEDPAGKESHTISLPFILMQGEVLTTTHGNPVDFKTGIQTFGPRGQMLMQDGVYLDEMAHFDRERIPERVVHAKGAGKHML